MAVVAVGLLGLKDFGFWIPLDSFGLFGGYAKSTTLNTIGISIFLPCYAYICTRHQLFLESLNKFYSCMKYSYIISLIKYSLHILTWADASAFH